MRRFSLGSLLFGLLFLWPMSVAAQSADVAAERPGNAALQYWQAFAQMPTLDKNQEKLLEQWNSVPLDATAQQLIAASQSSLMYLHRGAKLASCDWGLDYNDGIGLMLPHLAKARDLARLAALHARNEFEQGHWKEGRTDASAIMTLARHVGRDQTIVSLLVRYAIEGAVIDLVAPYVPDLKAPYDQVVALYKALPKAGTLEDSLALEKKFMAEWMIEKMTEQEKVKPGAGIALWKKIIESAEMPESLKQITQTEQAIKLTRDLLPVYDELAKFVVLSKGDFDAQFPSYKERLMAANAMASVLLPPVEKVRAKECRNEARLEMLLAAFAVAEGGSGKLQEIKDPFGTGPFEYRVVDAGFELQSKLVYEGAPVTLTIGRRKK